jgi:hypothetical protein
MQMQQQLKEMENIESEKDRQKDIEIALIGAEAKKEAASPGDQLNLQKMVREFELKERELDIREQELKNKMEGDRQNESIQREGNQVKREAEVNKKQIAKLNKKDKNAG